MGIVPGLVIGLREGIEAALIIGLIAGYLAKTGRGVLNKYVVTGAILAVIASVIVAGFLLAMTSGLEGTSEELFEGVSALLAVAILTFMIFWMMKESKHVRSQFQDRVDIVVARGEVYGLIGFAFIAVFREGVETALFMLGAAGATTASDAVAGVAIGLLIAVLIGIALPHLSVRISWKRFFQVTSIILVLFAAGLLARGVHEFQEAFSIQAGSASVYDLSGVFSSGEENPIGYLLHGILGYSDSPSQIEVVAYFGFLATCLFLYWYIILRTPKDTDQDKIDVAGNQGTVAREGSMAEVKGLGETDSPSGSFVGDNTGQQSRFDTVPGR